MYASDVFNIAGTGSLSGASPDPSFGCRDASLEK